MVPELLPPLALGAAGTLRRLQAHLGGGGAGGGDRDGVGAGDGGGDGGGDSAVVRSLMVW